MAAPPPPSWRGQQWIAAPPAASYADMTAPGASTGGSSGVLYAGGAGGNGNANGAGQEPSQAAPPAFRMPQRKGQELYVDSSQQQLYEQLRQQTLMQTSQRTVAMTPTAAIAQAQQQQEQLLMQMQQINQQQQLYQQQPQQQWDALAETDFEQIDQQQQQHQQQWNAPVRMDAYAGNQLRNQQQQVQLAHVQQEQVQVQQQQQQWDMSGRMDTYAGSLQQNQQVQAQQGQIQQEQQQQVQQQQQWSASPIVDVYAGNLQHNQQLQVHQIQVQQQQQQEQQQWDASMRMDVHLGNLQNTQQQQVQRVQVQQVQTKQQQVQTQPQQVQQQQQQYRRPYQFLESEIRDSASTGSGSDSGGTQRSTAVIQPGDAIVPEQYRDQIQIELPIPPQLGPPSFNLPFVQSRGGGYSGHSYGGYPGSEYSGGGGGVQHNMMSNQRSPVIARSAPPVTFVPCGVGSDEWPMPNLFNGYSNNSTSNDSNSDPVENQFGKTTWNREQHFSAAVSAINPSFSNANAQQGSPSDVFGRSQNLLSAPQQNQRRQQNKQSKRQQQQQQRRQQLQNQQHSAARAAAETLYALHSPVFSPARNEVNFGANGSNPWGQVHSTEVAENVKKASAEFRPSRLTQLLNMTVEQQNYELSVAADTSVGDDFLDVLVGRSQPGVYDSKIATGHANQSVPHQSSALQQPQESLAQSTTGYQLSNGHMTATGFRGAEEVPSHTQHLSANVLSKETKKKAPVKRKRVKDVAVHERRVQLPMSALIHSDSAVDEWVVPAPEPKKKGISRPQLALAYRMTSSTTNLHEVKPPTVSVLPANAAVKKKAPVKRKKKQDIATQESKSHEPITVPAAQKPKSGTVVAPTFSVPTFARIPGLELTNNNFAVAMPTPNALRNLMNPVEDASDSGTATECPDQGLVPPSSNFGKLPLLGSQSFFQPGGALQRLWEEKTAEKASVPLKQPKAKQPKAQRRNAQSTPAEKRSRKRKNEVAASNGVHVAPVEGTNTQIESNAPSSKSKAPQCAGGRKIRVVSKQVTDALMAEINSSYSSHAVVPAAKSGSTSSMSILPSKNASNPANASPIVVNNSIEKEVANGSRPLPGTWTERGFVQAHVPKPDEISVVDLSVGGVSSTLRTLVPIAPKPSIPRVNQSKEPVPPTAAVGIVGSKTQESAGGVPDHAQAASSEALSQPNNTIMIFCKRDFMRYQAAKLWKKYQEKKKKMEFQSVQVLGKRTRYVNARYEEEQAQAHVQAQKKAKGPKKKIRKAKTAGKSGSAQSNDSSLSEQAKKSRVDAQNLAGTRAEQAQRDEVNSADQTSNNESLPADQAHAQTNEMKLSEITPMNGVGSVEEPPSNEVTPVEQVSSAIPGAEIPAVTLLEQTLSSGSVSTEHTPDKKAIALEQNPSNEEKRLDQTSRVLTDTQSQANDTSPVEEASSGVEMAAAERTPIVAVTSLLERTASDETKTITHASSNEVECVEQIPSNTVMPAAEILSDMVMSAEPALANGEAKPTDHAHVSEVSSTMDAIAAMQTSATPSNEPEPDVQDSRSAEIPTMEVVGATRATDVVASVEQGVSAMPATDAPRIDETSLEHDPADGLMPAKKAPSITATPLAEIQIQEMTPMEQESTLSNAAPDAAVEFTEQTPRNEIALVEHDLDATPDAEAHSSAAEIEEVQSAMPIVEPPSLMVMPPVEALSCEVTPIEQEPSESTSGFEFEFLEDVPSKEVMPVEQVLPVTATSDPPSVMEIANASSSMPSLEAPAEMPNAETPSARTSMELSRVATSDEMPNHEVTPAAEASRDAMTSNEQEPEELTSSNGVGPREHTQSEVMPTGQDLLVIPPTEASHVMPNVDAQAMQVEQMPRAISTGGASSNEMALFVGIPDVEMEQSVEASGVEVVSAEQAYSKLIASSDSGSVKETPGNKLIPTDTDSSVIEIAEDQSAISTEEAPVALPTAVGSPVTTLTSSAETPHCEMTPFEQELYEITPWIELESVEQTSSTEVMPAQRALIVASSMEAPSVTGIAEVQSTMPTAERLNETRKVEGPCYEVTPAEQVPNNVVVPTADNPSYEMMLIEDEPYQLIPIKESNPVELTTSIDEARILQIAVATPTAEASSNETTEVDQAPIALPADPHQDSEAPFDQGLSNEVGCIEQSSSKMAPVVGAFRAMPTAAASSDEVMPLEQDSSVTPATEAPGIVETPVGQAPANSLAPLEQVPINELMLAEQASSTNLALCVEPSGENGTSTTEVPSCESPPTEQELSESTSSSDVEFVEVRQLPNNAAVPTLSTEVSSVTHITETLYVIPSAEAPSTKAALADQIPRAISTGEAPSDDVMPSVEARSSEMVPDERKRSAVLTPNVEYNIAELTSRDGIWPIKQVPTSLAQIANALSNKWTLLGQMPKATASTCQASSREVIQVEQKVGELPPSNAFMFGDADQIPRNEMLPTDQVSVVTTMGAPCASALADGAPAVKAPVGSPTVESPSDVPSTAETPNNEVTLLQQTPLAKIPREMSTVEYLKVMGAVEALSCEVTPTEQTHSELLPPSNDSVPVELNETTSIKQALIVTPTAETLSSEVTPVEQTTSNEEMSTQRAPSMVGAVDAQVVTRTPEDPCAKPAEQATCTTSTPEGPCVVPTEQVPMTTSTPQTLANEISPTADAPTRILQTADESRDAVTPTEQLSSVVATKEASENDVEPLANESSNNEVISREQALVSKENSPRASVNEGLPTAKALLVMPTADTLHDEEVMPTEQLSNAVVTEVAPGDAVESLVEEPSSSQMLFTEQVPVNKEIPRFEPVGTPPEELQQSIETKSSEELG